MEVVFSNEYIKNSLFSFHNFNRPFKNSVLTSENPNPNQFFFNSSHLKLKWNFISNKIHLKTHFNSEYFNELSDASFKRIYLFNSTEMHPPKSSEF